jgi:murein DD-endopeptidase MepM/ murein hydrolase activator NlpD
VSLASTRFGAGAVLTAAALLALAVPTLAEGRPGSTRELVAALSALPAPAARAGFGRFPVAGAATWSHDWLFPRHEPTFHVHQGTDVFAARGTVVQSPAIGTVRVSNGSVGGLAVKVVQDDGTYWYLAHLDEATATDGQRVGLGDPVGLVGDTGNAAGGAPHVHV